MATTVDPRWLGRRVSVRRLVPEGHLADALGDLIALNSDTATIETAHGPSEVALTDVVAARLVEPGTPDQLALERVAARGWRPALEQLSDDGWLLRADGGGTGRANSALVLRTPGRPLADAVADTRAWYAERGLPLLLAVPLPARSLLDGGLETTVGLTVRGAGAEDDSHVFVARIDRVLVSHPQVPVPLTGTPDDDWLAIFRDGAALTQPALRALLTRHDDVVFASVMQEGRTVAIGRAAVDVDPEARAGRPVTRWLGVTAIEVVPELRRQGLAKAVLAELVRWGAGRGATRTYLQVAGRNQAAVSLYLRAGYWHHHDYRYRLDPA